MRINAEMHHYPMPLCLSFSAKKTIGFFSLFRVADPKTFPRSDAHPWVANLNLNIRNMSLLSLIISQGVFRRAWSLTWKTTEGK